MIWLYFILHLFIGATAAGSLMIVALTMGYATLEPILIAGGAGFIGAFPITWVIARKLENLR